MPKVGSYRIQQVSVDLNREFRRICGEQTDADCDEQSDQAKEQDLPSGRLSGGRQVPRSALSLDLDAIRNVPS